MFAKTPLFPYVNSFRHYLCVGFFLAAVRGASVVFYLDSTEITPNDFYTCYKVIVEGAKNVINACRDQKVQHLIYNSSADVVFDTRHEINDGDESLPYAGKQGNMLADLKAQAEAFILFANDIDGLLTCALRPVNVFGPGDTDFMPSLIQMAKSRWFKFIIGRENVMSDFTFVENVAHAHICAESVLSSRTVSASGKAFFITNFEPISFSEFLSRVLEGMGYNRPTIKLPLRVARYIILQVKSMNSSMDCGSVHKILELSSCNRTFNCSAAQRHIGYSPIVSLEEGIVSTIQSHSHSSKSSSVAGYPDFIEQSKVEKLLGNGIVANILLWRDEKKTCAYFVSLLVLYYWFFLCGRMFISSAAKLLLSIVVFLFAYGVLPSRVFSFVLPRLSLSGLEISEVCASDAISSLAYTCSNVSSLIQTLAKGEDWHTFFKVAGLLYFVKVIVSNSLITDAIGVALALAFTMFLVYEQLQDEVDGTAALALSISRKAFRLLIKNLPPAVTSFSPVLQMSQDSGSPTSLR
ncbi:dehydratase [Lithospermum erythrorhizon]|uniref:Reticulon-like protein n=1 Tax=Lithospermum erythrorhizon TaxID=34254 RepID=A0AAV3RTL6_LITER